MALVLARGIVMRDMSLGRANKRDMLAATPAHDKVPFFAIRTAIDFILRKARQSTHSKMFTASTASACFCSPLRCAAELHAMIAAMQW
jgi:hypothetical protein